MAKITLFNPNLNILINKVGCLLLISLFIAALIAPFTFLKPPHHENSSKTKTHILLEKPLHNVKLPMFSKINDVKEKKRQFFAFIKPAIEKQNKKIMINRKRLLAIKKRYAKGVALTKIDKRFLTHISQKYKINSQLKTLAKVEQLLLSVDIVPVPLVLVQAANESAWGTSRFAKIGLNFFGMWCFEKGCGMVPKRRNKGAFHEVAAFSSVEEAVTKYLLNINTHAAYDVFRDIRGKLRQNQQPLLSEVLAAGLLPYSERGSEYVLEITNMIRHNKQYF